MDLLTRHLLPILGFLYFLISSSCSPHVIRLRPRFLPAVDIARVGEGAQSISAAKGAADLVKVGGAGSEGAKSAVVGAVAEGRSFHLPAQSELKLKPIPSTKDHPLTEGSSSDPSLISSTSKSQSTAVPEQFNPEKHSPSKSDLRPSDPSLSLSKELPKGKPNPDISPHLPEKNKGTSSSDPSKISAAEPHLPKPTNALEVMARSSQKREGPSLQQELKWYQSWAEARNNLKVYKKVPLTLIEWLNNVKQRLASDWMHHVARLNKGLPRRPIFRAPPEKTPKKVPKAPIASKSPTAPTSRPPRL